MLLQGTQAMTAADLSMMYPKKSIIDVSLSVPLVWHILPALLSILSVVTLLAATVPTPHLKVLYQPSSRKPQATLVQGRPFEERVQIDLQERGLATLATCWYQVRAPCA